MLVALFCVQHVNANDLIEPRAGIIQVDYLNDATSIADEVAWVANNRSILMQEERINDIVKHRTASVSAFAVDDNICWRESYGRGAGTIPTGCSNGKEYENGLCYTKCTRPGFEGGGGPLCLAKCPSNFTDTGLHCLKPAAYGRGAGRVPDVTCPSGFYQRGVGTAAWCDNRATWPWDLETRSASYTCRSGEERWGGLCYPKCKSGFKAFACCVCSPICPTNTVDIGVSCQKDSYGRGVGTIPTGCSGGKENQAGLCYKKCSTGKKGVGPVCWETKCPANYPVNCGLSCAVSSSKCMMATIDQVTAPLEVVLTIGEFAISGGAITAARKGATMAAKAGVKAAAKTAVKKVTKEAAKKAIKKSMKEMGKTIAEGTIEEMSMMLVDAEAQRAFNEEQNIEGPEWEDLALLDPTGISGLVLAYAKPLCIDVKNDPTKGIGGADDPLISGGTGLDIGVNIAKGKRARQHSTSGTGKASNATDGNTDGNWRSGSVTHTDNTNNPWWEVDLGSNYDITKIMIHNRSDCCKERLHDFSILVSENSFSGNSGGKTFASHVQYGFGIRTFRGNARGRFVRIFKHGSGILSLAEVEINGKAVTKISTSTNSSSSSALPVNKFVRIENRWMTGERINVETGKLASTKIKDGAWSAMWIIKPVAGTKYYRIENRWKVGHRLHVETGKLESSPIKDGAWSAMWEIKPVAGTPGAYRIENRWKTGYRIHRERGPVEAGPMKDGAWSAMWYIKSL